MQTPARTYQDLTGALRRQLGKMSDANSLLKHFDDWSAKLGQWKALLEVCSSAGQRSGRSVRLSQMLQSLVALLNMIARSPEELPIFAQVGRRRTRRTRPLSARARASQIQPLLNEPTVHLIRLISGTIDFACVLQACAERSEHRPDRAMQ
jgi:hypothetical protein